MRKQKLVVISSEGRDKGKTFRLTEMPADQAERWAYRTLLAMSRGGIDLPNGILNAGMAGLAAVIPFVVIVGLRGLHMAQWAELEPLLEEMMGCVRYVPPQQGLPDQEILSGVNSQIEEIRTRVELRKEILELHVDPSLAAAMLDSQGGQGESASAAEQSS